MKILLLAGEQSNQAALAHKLAAAATLCGVVISRNVPRKEPARRLRGFVSRVEGRLLGRPFIAAWTRLLERYDSHFPEVPIARVENINDDATHDAIASLRPDAVLVSGTNLVGKRLLERATQCGPTLNLHTGLSPYIKGGPNCTNFCLTEGRFELIGNTVMWLDAGVDSGDLVATERTAIDGTEDLDALHFKVMEHAHELYVRCVRVLASGKTLPRIPQRTIAYGRTYRNADWNARAILLARRNLRRFNTAVIGSATLAARAAELELVALPSDSATRIADR